MKGIILAGGLGTRLGLLTKITNKHLLPVYDKPMIYFPLQILLDAGIRDIMIISGPEHSGDFLRLLGSGRQFNAKFTYEIQDEPKGIAHALGIAEDFADKDNVTVVLGDNIFEDDFSDIIKEFRSGAMVFVKEADDTNRFGVADIKDGKVIVIEEKPSKPKSNFAVTGLYIYDKRVFEIIKGLKPSKRGELEITDVSNHYIKSGELRYSVVKGFWSDAGTLSSLYKAASFVKSKRESE